MKEAIIQKILFDYFEGRATSMQQKLIADWLKADLENESLFYQFLDEWESQNPQYLSDNGIAWKKFETVLNTPVSPDSTAAPENPNEPANSPRLRWGWYMAASIAIVMMASLFFFQKTIFYRTYHADYAQTLRLKLSDGTAVVLNANSRLWVSRWGFNDRNRVVFLDGEGEFKVAHTTHNNRFVVKTNSDFEVEVFGTQFVVYARENAKKVVLNEGKVQVNYQAGKQQFMKPGDIVSLQKGSDTLEMSTTKEPQKYSAWKYHQFYFDETTLATASTTIKEHFGVQVAFRDSTMANRRFSGSFKAEKPIELFNALSLLLNLDIRQQNDTAFISAHQ